MSFARWMVAFKIKLYKDIRYVQSDMKKIKGWTVAKYWLPQKSVKKGTSFGLGLDERSFKERSFKEL